MCCFFGFCSSSEGSFGSICPFVLQVSIYFCHEVLQGLQYEDGDVFV